MTKYYNLLSDEEKNIADRATGQTLNTISHKGARRFKFLSNKIRNENLVKLVSYKEFEEIKTGLLDAEKLKKRLYTRSFVQKNPNYMKEYSKKKYHAGGSWRTSHDISQELYISKRRIEKKEKALEKLEQREKYIGIQVRVLKSEISAIKNKLEIMEQNN